MNAASTLGEGSLLQLIRRTFDPTPVDAENVERLKQHRLAQPDAAGDYYPQRIESQFTDVVSGHDAGVGVDPVVWGIATPAVGRHCESIWIREYFPPWDETNEWFVFDPIRTMARYGNDADRLHPL